MTICPAVRLLRNASGCFATVIFAWSLTATTLYGQYRYEVVPEGDSEVVSDTAPDFETIGDGYFPDGTPAPPAPIYYTRDWYNRGAWYTRQDFVLLNRGKPRVRGLSGRAFEVLPTVDPDTLLPRLLDSIAVARPITFESEQVELFDDYLTTQSARLRTAPGARITLGRRLGTDDQNRDREIEFTFFGLFEWDAANQLTTKPDASINEVFALEDRLIGGYSFAEFHKILYSSDLNSYEFNYRFRHRPGRDRVLLNPNGTWTREAMPALIPTFLGGIRYMQINERFEWLAEGPNPETQRADYLVVTQNDLLGLQFGLELLHHSNWCTLGCMTKAGGYVNFAEQHSLVAIIDNDGAPPNRDELARTEPMAFVTDLELFARFQLHSNIILRTAWNLQYIQGIAVAPEQIMLNPLDEGRINASGFTVNTGASIGFEAYW
jgi:hypothetical protein